MLLHFLPCSQTVAAAVRLTFLPRVHLFSLLWNMAVVQHLCNHKGQDWWIPAHSPGAIREKQHPVSSEHGHQTRSLIQFKKCSFCNGKSPSQPILWGWEVFPTLHIYDPPGMPYTLMVYLNLNPITPMPGRSALHGFLKDCFGFGPVKERWRTHAVKQTTESPGETLRPRCLGPACWHKGSTRIVFHMCNRLSNTRQRVNCRVASLRSLFSKMNPGRFLWVSSQKRRRPQT